jgi:hypothetical protein
VEGLFVKHPAQHKVPSHDDDDKAVNRLTELNFSKKSYLPVEGNVNQQEGVRPVACMT